MHQLFANLRANVHNHKVGRLTLSEEYYVGGGYRKESGRQRRSSAVENAEEKGSLSQPVGDERARSQFYHGKGTSGGVNTLVVWPLRW